MERQSSFIDIFLEGASLRGIVVCRLRRSRANTFSPRLEIFPDYHPLFRLHIELLACLHVKCRISGIQIRQRTISEKIIWTVHVAHNFIARRIVAIFERQTCAKPKKKR
jgi:hypothetical protein